jgi:hypothetical protein
MTLLAAASAVDITPPIGTPLDGYSGRNDVALGIHDSLYARCLLLDDGASRIALIVCDLIGVGEFLAERARALIAERPGVPAENVLIAATHTHAGPAGVRGRGDETLVDSIARKIAGAALTASLALQPAALKHGTTSLESIAQNRRDPAWPIDTRLDVLAIDTPEGRNIATAARYSCHATTMERNNLLVSADYPGAACATIEQVVGHNTTALFFNGCCGNVNPTWIRQEFDDMRRVGTVVGATAAALSQQLRPLGVNHQAHNIRWNELTEKPVNAGRLVPEMPLQAARRPFEAPYRSGPPDAEMATLIADLSRQREAATTVQERRRISESLTRAQGERTALQRIAGRGPARTEEVQAFRLGAGFYLLGLPGEVFVETQEEIRARSGIDDLVVVAYANDYPGYFCRPEAYDQGGYEAGVTPFAPEADGRLVEAALAVLEEVR